MKKIFPNLLLYVIFITFSSSLFAQELYNVNTTALYINKITKSISQQLSKNQARTIYDKTMSIMFISNKVDASVNPVFKQRVKENLLYSMSLAGFKLVDMHSLKILGHNIVIPEYILVINLVDYKDGLVVNARILEKQTAIIISVAQVNVSKKIMRKIYRVYKKDGWFNK